MSSQSSTVTTAAAGNDFKVNDSKEIKEQQQSRKRKEPSASSSSSSLSSSSSASIIENDNRDSSSKEPKMIKFEHDNAWPSPQHSSSPSSSSSNSAASSSSSSSFGGASATPTYFQMATSRKAAHEASKLNFHAERGPFPFKKHPMPLTTITIMEWRKDGARMVDSIHRLKKDFYPIAYDASKKEVLFQASENEYYIRETEAGRKYKDWFHIQKHAKQVLEKNAEDQQALKEKALEENGYSQELKNEADALLAEEVLMQNKVRMPQPERPAIIQDAITIMSEMRLPLGLYKCNVDDNDAEKAKKNDPQAFNRSSISSSSASSSSNSNSNVSDSSSSSSSSSSASNSIATHHASHPSRIKPLRTYEIRLATELIDEERMEYKVQVETWDKAIHHIECKSGFAFSFEIVIILIRMQAKEHKGNTSIKY